MTSVVMFSNLNEPLLTKIKEKHAGVDLNWLMKQGSMVSETQRNIVRAECKDQSGVHLMVFPQDYHVKTLQASNDPHWLAWTKETGIRQPTEHYAHGGVSLYIY